jgi:hypothetical protein
VGRKRQAEGPRPFVPASASPSPRTASAFGARVRDGFSRLRTKRPIFSCQRLRRATVTRFRGRLYRRLPLRNRAMSRVASRTSMSAKSVRRRSARAGAQARRRVFALVLARGIRAYRWDARRILAVNVTTLRPQRGQREARSARLARSASHSGCGDPRAPSSQRDAPLAVGTDFLQRRSAGVRAGLRSQGEDLDARSPRRWEPAGLPATGSRRGSEPRWGRSPRRPRLGALGRAMGAGGLPRAPSPCPTFHCTHRNAKRSSSSLWAMGLRHAGRLLRE